MVMITTLVLSMGHAGAGLLARWEMVATNGKCMHDDMSICDQIQIFAANHQGNDNATVGTKKWKHGGADRLPTHDATKLFWRMMFERLGRPTAAANQVSCCGERHELHCNVLLPEDVALFDKRVTKETPFSFHGALQASIEKGRQTLLCSPFEIGEHEANPHELRKQVFRHKRKLVTAQLELAFALPVHLLNDRASVANR
jgi:hypothetical protein